MYNPRRVINSKERRWAFDMSGTEPFKHRGPGSTCSSSTLPVRSLAVQGFISSDDVLDRGIALFRDSTMDYAAAKAFILAQLQGSLPYDRTYHSYGHTLDVHRAAIDIARKEGVNGNDLMLLKTAALYHDAGFVRGDVHHEVLSCDIVREALPGFGYTTEEVDRICAMIMATRVPQSPTDQLSGILCDADLDYLGREDFFTIGNHLFRELKEYGILTTERAWNEIQLKFLSEHTYFTETNRRDREPRKQLHLARVVEWLERNP